MGNRSAAHRKYRASLARGTGCFFTYFHDPYAQHARILEFGIGLTDLVKRPTPSSADLSPAEARAGVLQLQTKLVTYAPRVVCFNGKGVYAWYTNRAVDIGPQNGTIGAARVF